MTLVSHDSHLSGKKIHAHSSGAVPCCTPRLWRSLQTLIQDDARDELARQLSAMPEQYVHILATSRLANDPGQYSPSQKSRVLQFPAPVRQEAVHKFGKSVTDLDAIQMALILRREQLAIQLVHFLRQHAPPKVISDLIHHPWGQRNTTLHLACFWNMTRLVRLLLEMGADQPQNGRRVRPADCCTSTDCLALLEAKNPSVPPDAPASRRSASPSDERSPLQRPSMLLKKATERPRPSLVTDSSQSITRLPSPVSALPIPEAYFKKPTRDAAVDYLSPPATPTQDDQQKESLKALRVHHALSPLSFSSSSSSSSLSSMSSTDDVLPGTFDAHCWTPPPSPMTTPPPPPLMSKQPSLLDVGLSEMGLADQNLFDTPERPACFPSMRPPPQKALRQVRFDPCVVLTEACTRGDLAELVHQMEDHSLDTTLVSGGIGGAKNRSLIHIAVIHNHEALVKYLSSHVDVNHRDTDGWSALHYAAALRRWKLLEYLVSLEQMDLQKHVQEDNWMIYACVETEVDKRRCKLILERAIRRAKLKERAD